MKKLMCLIIAFALIIPNAFSIVSCADELTDEEIAASTEQTEREEHDSLQQEQQAQEYESSFFESAVNQSAAEDTSKYWIQYEGDRTGLTDTQIVALNYKEYWKSQSGNDDYIISRANEALQNWTGNGGFLKIDYTQPNISRHWGYLTALGLAYDIDRPDNQFYHNDTVKEILPMATEYVFDKLTYRAQPTGWISNWWLWTIGMPLNLQPYIATCRDFLPEEMVAEVLNRYFYSTEEVNPGYLEGTNTIWYAMQGILKGAILNDEALIHKCVNQIAGIVSVADYRDTNQNSPYISVNGPQGIMPDGSFHQHQAQFYPNYGENAIKDFSQLAMMTYGTKFEPKEYYESYFSYLLNGAVDIYRGNEGEILLSGRGIGQTPSISNDPYANRIYVALKIFKKILPERAEEFELAARTLLPPSHKDRIYPEKTKYYNLSEYFIHHRKDYSFSNKINTERTIAMEYSPTQAKFAWNVNIGQINLRKGNEQTQYGRQPLWDWKILPGVTCSYRNYFTTEYSSLQWGSYGGGVSDGKYGMTSMFLVNRETVSAKKSVFCFDDEIVLLGCDINSQSNNVNTGIDQRVLTGDISCDGTVISTRKEHSLKDVSYVFHNNIGYVFPEKEDIKIRNTTRRGAITDYTYSLDVSPEVKQGDMFLMWVPHGNSPVNGKYSFIIVPETDEAALKEYSQNIPVTVAENSGTVQAVYHNKLKIAQMAFFKNGKADINENISVSSDSPAIVMISELDDSFKVCVADPYNSQTTVNLTLELYGSETKLRFDLPKYDQNHYDHGGETVIKTISK